jgi:hypothetical protein
MDAGISMQDHSGELFIDECVTEYTFSGLVHLLDKTCDAWVRNCNIHSSSADPYEVGINSNGGSILVHDCKLVGFYGPAIIANGGRISAQGNMLWDGAALVSGAGNGSIISGNFIKRPAVTTPGYTELQTASPPLPLIALRGHGITVNNNNVEDSGLAGSILDVGNSTAVLVSGNVFETSDAHADTRWAIIARNDSSAFISGNLFVKANAMLPNVAGLAAKNNWIAGKLKTDDSTATFYWNLKTDDDSVQVSAMTPLKTDDGSICDEGSTPTSATRSYSLVGGDNTTAQSFLSGIEVSGSSTHVVWSHVPMLPAIARLTLCIPTGCEHEEHIVVDQIADDMNADIITIVITVNDHRSKRCPVSVHVEASINRLDGLRSASSVADGNSKVTECSDGVDNDGDGLADDADPGCQTATRREDSDNTAPTSLSWEWGKATDGDFMKELRWTNAATGVTVPVVQDEPFAGVTNGCRWWPHGGNCSHWLQSYGNNSARQIQDWAWRIDVPDGHAGGPQHLEQESAITKRLVSSNATSAVFESYSDRLRLTDVYTLRGDTMFISINATNQMTAIIRATFLTQFGSLQLGPAASPAIARGESTMWHLGNKRLGSLDRNWSYVEACVYPYDGFAPMPSRACFSAASAMGDADHFSVGIQCLTPISPDGTDALLAYMDVPANPRTPTSTTTLTLVLRPGETRNFVLALKIAPPAGIGLARPAVLKSMESSVDPYVKLFHSVWGRTPQYCPTPSISYEDAINYGLNRNPSVCGKRYPTGNKVSHMQNCNPYGTDTDCDCWWANGTRMYDVFNIDRLLTSAVTREYGSPYHIAWRPGVQSSHLTTPSLFEQCEFNPNAEVMDPHQDVFWNDSIWSNITTTAASAGFSLGWGLRSTEEILTPDNRSATIVRDPTQASGYRINSGMCVNFEGFFGDKIGNASSPDSDGRGVRWGNLLGAQTDRLVARFKMLVGRGVKAFCECRESHLPVYRIATATMCQVD